MSKKKFNETKVGKFLSQVAPKLLNTVGGVLPDSGALGILRNIITEAPTVDITPEDKKKALKLLELDRIEMQEVTKRWTSDMASTSWLSKNVRPITLVFFFCCLYYWVVCWL